MNLTGRIINASFFCFFCVIGIIDSTTAQSCSGHWATPNFFTYDCLTGQGVGLGNSGDPTGCPVNPVYTAAQTSTFIFDTPVDDFTLDFNAFSTGPGCARLQVKMNGVFYPLTASNLVNLPAGSTCTGSTNYLAITAEGYITGSSSSLYNTNGQGRLLFNGVNASSITVSTNDGAASIYADPCEPLIIPIRLKRFSGRALDDCRASFFCETTLEVNVARIELLRAFKGRNFTKVADIQPKGNNSNYVVAVDHNSPAFYQLKIIDLDGAVTYSQVINITSHCTSGHYMVIPNPVHSNLRIAGAQSGDKVFISDMLGRTQRIFNIGESNQSLNVKELSAGIYLIKIMNNANIVGSLRFIKHY